MILEEGTEGEDVIPPDTTPATEPLRCSIKAFCCSFTVTIVRRCSIVAESAYFGGYPIIGDTLLFLSSVSAGLAAAVAGAAERMSVLIGCEMPLMVTRRFLDGEGCAALLLDWPGDALVPTRADGSWCCSCADRT